MKQVEAPQQEPTQVLTFRDYVDIAIIFGCIPALILNIVLWAIAITFSHAGLLPSILTLLITLLLSFIALILLVRYVDIAVGSLGKYNTSFEEGMILMTIGAGGACIVLAGLIIASLSQAGVLEGAHYTLMIFEVLLVGYQTWRVFDSKEGTP